MAIINLQHSEISDQDNLFITVITTAIDVESLVVWLNGQNPAIEIKPKQIFEFKLVNGTRYRLENKGKGLYGINNIQVISSDFTEIFHKTKVIKDSGLRFIVETDDNNIIENISLTNELNLKVPSQITNPLRKGFTTTLVSKDSFINLLPEIGVTIINNRQIKNNENVNLVKTDDNTWILQRVRPLVILEDNNTTVFDMSENRFYEGLEPGGIANTATAYTYINAFTIGITCRRFINAVKKPTLGEVLEVEGSSFVVEIEHSPFIPNTNMYMVVRRENSLVYWFETFELSDKINFRTAFFPYGLKLAATDQVDIPSSEFFSIANVHEFKGSANVVLPTASSSTFKNVIQWDSNNNDGNADLKYSVIVAYSTDGDIGHKVSIILQETISNVSFKQWAFSPILANKSYGSLDFSYWIRVENILTNHFKAEIISNGIRFTIDTLSGNALNLEDSLLEFFPINQPWTVSNFSVLNRINFQANFPDAMEIYKMEFATSDNGLGYNNPNTIWDKEELLFDYSGSKIGKNRLFTLKNASNIIPESFFIKKKISGRVNFIDNDGMAKPLELVTGVFERKFDNFPLQSIVVEDMLDRAIRIGYLTWHEFIIKTKFMEKSMKNLDKNYEIDERLTGLFLPEVNLNKIIFNPPNPPSLANILVNIVNPESGYFTLSRETVKYRHRESLLIEEISSGSVAVDYLNGFPELIVEPQRTNLVRNSEPTAIENDDTEVTYEAISNPFGFGSWAKIVPNQTSIQLRWAGEIATPETVKNTYFFNRHGDFLLNASGAGANYEFILAVGGVPTVNLENYKIKLKKINEQFHIISSQRLMTLSSANHGVWLNQQLTNFHPIIFSGLMTEIVPSFNLFHGSYIRTTGVTKTVDADVYTINNLVANGLISATEGTIIERGSNQEVRTVWTGGNKLKFIDNALVSTIVELPNDNAFMLDTSSYRLSEVLVYNVAILP